MISHHIYHYKKYLINSNDHGLTLLEKFLRKGYKIV